MKFTIAENSRTTDLRVGNVGREKIVAGVLPGSNLFMVSEAIQYRSLDRSYWASREGDRR